MNTFADIFNSVLVEVYHNIVRVEEDFLRNHRKINLSIREMHLIECVGQNKGIGKTVSEIAEYLKISKPSATIAVNKLENKGYLKKQGSDDDGRIVHVTLTKEGRIVDMHHHLYHVSMVQAIENEFTEEERQILIRMIEKLNEFFKGGIKEKI